MIITSRVMRALLRKYKYENFMLEDSKLDDEGVRVYRLEFENETKYVCMRYLHDYEEDYLEVIEL